MAAQVEGYRGLQQQWAAHNITVKSYFECMSRRNGFLSFDITLFKQYYLDYVSINTRNDTTKKHQLMDLLVVTY